jgi:predicted AAA+ superfamily ATPase
MATSRKMRKAYPNNIAFARIFAPEANIGKVIETAVLLALDAEYYFRDNHTEIDFILKSGKIVPVEVKYGKKVELKQFTRALNKIGLDYGIVITRDIYKEEEIKGKRILMVPAWAFLLFKQEFIRRLDP